MVVIRGWAELGRYTLINNVHANLTSKLEGHLKKLRLALHMICGTELQFSVLDCLF